MAIASPFPAGSRNSTEIPSWIVLAIIILGAVALRVTGLFWLTGVGHAPDFSFITDDQRFIDLAKDFRAGMPDGYVHGMTTHLLILQALVQPFWPDANLLQLLKIVTVTYAGLTVWMTFVIAKSWSLGNGTALLAAFFLATSPTHLVTSNFGTADVTAVFYFYLSIFLAGKYLLTRDQLWFVLATALIGAAIAIKLFLPLLVPLLLLVLVHRGRELITQAIAAALISAGAFEVFSLFAYAPWDLSRLAQVLREDVVSIVAGNSPIRNLALYVWDSFSALSLPVAALLAVSSIAWAMRTLNELRSRAITSFIPSDWRDLITPKSLLLLALAAHAVLIATAGVHAVRHLLVFIPVACVIAATAFSQPRFASAMRTAALTVLLAYGVGNAISVEAIFTNDIRADVRKATALLKQQGKDILTFSEFTRLEDVTFEKRTDTALLDSQTYIITCDVEYNAYLRNRDASKLYAAFGGQQRADFFWGVFDGNSDFHIARIFRQRPLSLEQKLIDQQILRPIGTYIPKTCVLLTRDPAISLQLSAQDLRPRYFQAGW